MEEAEATRSSFITASRSENQLARQYANELVLLVAGNVSSGLVVAGALLPVHEGLRKDLRGNQ
jgi:hypothetical protein